MHVAVSSTCRFYDSPTVTEALTYLSFIEIIKKPQIKYSVLHKE